MSAVLERETLIDQGDVDRWSCRCVSKPNIWTYPQPAEAECSPVSLWCGSAPSAWPVASSHPRSQASPSTTDRTGERGGMWRMDRGELDMCQKVEAVNAAVNVRRLQEKHIRCHMFHCCLVLIQVCCIGWFSCSSLIFFINLKKSTLCWKTQELGCMWILDP